MYKEKINKKTAIIAVLLIFATIISVYAISNAIQARKAATNANISPYKYGLVVAYYGYWKTGDSYFADVDYPGQRKNIGKVPSEYAEFDLTFPTTLIEGNYEIDSIIDFRNYTGSWKDLNYSNMDEDEVRNHYIEYASIWNPQAYIGEKNTEVTFTASFRLLNPPDPDFSGSKFAKDMGGGVYKCYIAVVIKYVDSDFVKDPDKWWRDHGGNPDDPDPNPGTGDLMVYVNYKEKGTEKTLADMQKVRTSMGSNLVLSGKSIDGYKCVSSSIKGITTKNYESNYINEVVGRYDYTTPPDGYLLTVTFYYEKSDEKPSDNWCDPEFDFDADSAHIQMKRSEFEKLKDEDNIFFPDVQFSISNMKFGKKDGKEMPGQHGFESWDIYFKYSDKGYDYQRYGLMNKREKISLNVPKKYFKSENEENSTYRAGIEAHAGLNCICGGFTAERDSTSLFVDIIENMPPEAYYEYATIKTLPSGEESKISNKAFVGKDVYIDNQCSDPNGLKDIDFVRFDFKNMNSPSQIKSIQLVMKQWGVYEIGEYDLFDDTCIEFKQIIDGNLKMVFNSDDQWEVSVYVQDLDGLSDIYTNIIKPEVLTLKPTAVIKDTIDYRYPRTEEFNGKQNRILQINSNSSYVASWLSDMDVSIDHEKDMWDIEPLDGQNINCAKFERDINKNISGNILNARYEHLDIKMMFKEPGKYKARLQVTDTEGNVSDWTEQIITINEDLPPNVTGLIGGKYYRNSSGIASIYLSSINPTSIDSDIAVVYYVGYRYDTNNNGDFEDEALKQIEYKNPVSLQTTDLGKYQFTVRVKEEFRQETLQEYITDEDIKKASMIFLTEVDNIAPDVTKFKIMRVEE